MLSRKIKTHFDVRASSQKRALQFLNFEWSHYTIKNKENFEKLQICKKEIE